MSKQAAVRRQANMLRPLCRKYRLRFSDVIAETCTFRNRQLHCRGTRKPQCSGMKSNPTKLLPIDVRSRFETYVKEHRAKSFAMNKFFCTTCSSDKTDSCIEKPIKWPSGKPASFKFHEETEAAMNKQINVELKAFYYYLSMAAYFGRADVALPGCESFFMQMHHEEHEHALKFLNYIKMRGGRVNLCAVAPPDDEDWKCPLHAFKTALELESEVSEKLVIVNKVAEKHGDLNASDFIVTGFMEDQMKSVNEMGRFVAVLSGIGDHALARFIFDKDLLENHVISKFNVLHGKSTSNDTTK